MVMDEYLSCRFSVIETGTEQGDYLSQLIWRSNLGFVFSSMAYNSGPCFLFKKRFAGLCEKN